MHGVKLFIAVLIITGMTVLTPGRALSELDINSDSWSNLSENKASTLHFSDFSSAADTTTSDEYLDIDGASTPETGYWFEDVPWLGVTPETSLSPNDKVNSETSMDGDTDFDPLNSFILLRYAHGPFQPFVGVGPTLFISNFGRNNTIDVIHNLFMGFNYRF